MDVGSLVCVLWRRAEGREGCKVWWFCKRRRFMVDVLDVCSACGGRMFV